MPVVINDDIRIGIELEKRRYSPDAVHDAAVYQHPAFGGHIIGKRQLGEVPGRPRDTESSETAADREPAVAFVIGIVIILALRMVELALFGLNVNVGIRALA